MPPRRSPHTPAPSKRALRSALALLSLGVALAVQPLLAQRPSAPATTRGAQSAQAGPAERATGAEVNPEARARFERLARIAKYLDASTRSGLARVAAFGPGPIDPSGYTAQQVTLGSGRVAWIQAYSTSVAPPVASALAPPVGAPPAGGGPSNEILVPGVGGYDLLLRITVPSTGLDELFSLYVPGTPPNSKRPMVVGFHGFGVSHLDLLFSTSFFFECEQRDWFMVAPFQFSAVGNSQIHFSSPQSQEHVEAVLDWVTSAYAVDKDRVFGVGFSQGGGAALSYAARHRDDEAVQFAAVANHTGTVSNRGAYLNSNGAVQAEMQLLFGGAPGQKPFEYQRSSVIDTNANAGLIPSGRHMATNLESTPILSVYGLADPLTYLVDQTVALDGFMAGLPASSHTLLGATVPAPCFQGGLTGHCWSTLDEAFVCDWFADKVLGEPERGSLLIDESGRWDAIEVQQAATGSFSSLSYLFERSVNRFILFDRENVERLGVDLAAVNFSATTQVDVATTAIDGAPVAIDVDGLIGPPSAVRRNGVAVVQSCLPPGLFPTWCYSAATGTLTLNETGGALAVWEIVP